MFEEANKISRLARRDNFFFYVFLTSISENGLIAEICQVQSLMVLNVTLPLQ